MLPCISISDFRLLLPKSHPDSFHLNRFKFQQQNYSARLRQRSAARRGRRGSQLISWTVLDSLWYCPLPLHICRPRTDNEVRQTQRGPSGNSPVPAKTGLLWLDLNSWSDKFSGHSTLLPPAAAADVRTFQTSCITFIKDLWTTTEDGPIKLLLKANKTVTRDA